MKVALPTRSLAQPWPDLLNGTPLTFIARYDQLHEHTPSVVCDCYPVTRSRRMSFKAFISYSHAADGKLAPAVQRPVWRSRCSG